MKKYILLTIVFLQFSCSLNQKHFSKRLFFTLKRRFRSYGHNYLFKPKFKFNTFNTKLLTFGLTGAFMHLENQKYRNHLKNKKIKLKAYFDLNKTLSLCPDKANKQEGNQTIEDNFSEYCFGTVVDKKWIPLINNPVKINGYDDDDKIIISFKEYVKSICKNKEKQKKICGNFISDNDDNEDFNQIKIKFQYYLDKIKELESSSSLDNKFYVAKAFWKACDKYIIDPYVDFSFCVKTFGEEGHDFKNSFNIRYKNSEHEIKENNVGYISWSENYGRPCIHLPDKILETYQDMYEFYNKSENAIIKENYKNWKKANKLCNGKVVFIKDCDVVIFFDDSIKKYLENILIIDFLNIQTIKYLCGGITKPEDKKSIQKSKKQYEDLISRGILVNVNFFEVLENDNFFIEKFDRIIERERAPSIKGFFEHLHNKYLKFF